MIDQELILELTESYLKYLISEASESLSSDFDSLAPFGELGINSFHVLKIIKVLEADFGALSKTLLFEHFNIHDLSHYFVKKHSDVLIAKFSNELNVGIDFPAEINKQGKSDVTSKTSSSDLVTINDEQNSPTLILEKAAYAHAELSDLIQRLFSEFKNETSVSRGTRNIAPYLFIGSENKGYFNLSRSKKIILVYAYTGPEAYFDTLACELLQYCNDYDLELNLFSGEQLKAIGETPFSATPFGVVQRIINLQEFSLTGGPMRRLRYQISKFEKSGNCKTVEYICGSHPETDQNIANVIDAWCQSRTMVNPLIYTVKEEILAGNLSKEHRVFITFSDDVLQNVILISSMSSDENGYLMDLEFYAQDMPLGGLEYAIVNIIKTLVAEECNLLSLGGTYGCKLSDSSNADPDVDRILDELREQNIFNDSGNFQFKNKFRPENSSIYLCRAVTNKNHTNIIDIIMMIAEPSQEEFVDVKTQAADKVISTTSSIINNDELLVNTQKNSDTLVLQGEHRSIMLADFGFNPLRIPNEQIEFDLKTDSWAQLTLPVIGKQMKQLHSQLQQPINIDDTLRAIFPFKYFSLTRSGRMAEDVFYQAWSHKGVVLQSMLFPTAIFHQIDKGFTPKEIASPIVFTLDSDTLFKGEVDWQALQQNVQANAANIAMVCLEVSNNATGGHPISIEHLQQVKNILSENSISLVLDGTRIIENALFVIENEAGYASKTVWEVAHQIFSYADAITVSLAKDFCLDKGGLIATNDVALYEKLQNLISSTGCGLDVIDKKLVALALQKRKQIETHVTRRKQWVKLIWQTLSSRNIPVVAPPGAHCILIDVKQVSAFNNVDEPVASFLAWMYLNTGIRGGAHSVGMQNGSSLNGLVRLAIPVGLTQAEVESIIHKLVGLFEDVKNVPELLKQEEDNENFGVIDTIYQLKQYRLLSGSTVSRTDFKVQQLVNATPVTQSASSVEGRANSIVDKQPTDFIKNVVDQKSPPFVVSVKDEANTYRPQDIAIVGMAGRHPKADNLTELWNNLIQGRDCIDDIPEYRFKGRRQPENMGKYRGGFIENVDKFDSLFFNISPREAEAMDPQERLFLEVAWEAIEDAGYYPETLVSEGGPRDIGVFVGAVWTMYQTLGAEERLLGNHVISNSFLWSIANRVSYSMNLSGPSLAVDTACSASLTALNLACESIYKGECSGAIVGGVNLDVHRAKQEMTINSGALSEDGLCRSFGKGANGYVAGEGINALFIKPLNQAISDGDNIQGVIKSIAINHGGKTSGYSVPNPKAQTEVIVAALDKAKIDARSIGYIEAHGTGTELGDPIEITGLTNAYEKHDVDKQSCAIGSVKTNIGHLEAAAGLASICKVLLQMKFSQLVPSLHSAELNEFIDFENSPFYVEQKVEAWKNKRIEGVSYPLRAGISSFGAGGANAHVIVEKYEQSAKLSQQESDNKAPQIFPLSAKSEEQLHEMVIRLQSFIQNDLSQSDNSIKLNLNDIAYTLQVGRKSFVHRLVVIANSKNQLLEKLSCFIESKKDPDVLFGKAKNSDGISALLNNHEKKEFIRIVSEGRDNRKLAQLWIDDLLSDWQGNKEQLSGKRTSLPTYPFADKRHWIADIAPSSELSFSSGTKLHPLVDTNESTFERQIFKKTFNEQEFFIYDHLVSDIPTLPGVAYLDLVRKAGEIAAGRKVQKIKNILWVSPLTVENSIPTETFVELKPNGETINFEVFGNKADGGKQLYSQGKLSYASEEEENAESEYIDLQSIKARCAKVVEGKDAYPLFKSLGLHLGPSFQVLQNVYKNNEEVLGELKIPDIRAGDFDDYILHPSLVDGSFQAAMGAQLVGDTAGEMIVPYSLGQVEILHPLTPVCYSYVVEAKDNKKSGSNLSKKNVLIVGPDGKILVRVTDSVGVALTDVHEKPAVGETQASSDDEFTKLYYSSVWEKSLLSGDITSESLDNILLFDVNNTLMGLYQQRLKAAGKKSDHIVLVKPGEKYEQVEEAVYTINPKNKADYIQLIKTLSDKQWSINKICFAWPAIPVLNFENEYRHDVLKEPLAKGVYAFLNLCQSMIELKLEDKTQLLYLFLSSKDTPQIHNEAINGFAKILQAESPKLDCKILEIQQDTFIVNDDVLEIILSEYILDSTKSLTVLHDEQGRYVKEIKRLNLDETIINNASQDIVIKEKGVYLITGGAGGLGLLFAEYLAKQCHAKLVLTGRSELSKEREEQLNAIRELGAQVLYIPSDISDYEDVKRLIAETKAEFGEINGIIHSAGVLRDAYIRNKTAEEMNAVFAPKLNGSLHLDEITKHEKLDFFVMFSSLAALAGNAGQSDYSFANHFMDSFAHKRNLLRDQGLRVGKTLSLNWSLWADGGMQLDAQTEQFFRNSLGIKPLAAQTGIDTFIRGLSSNLASFAVIEGVQDKIEKAWGIAQVSDQTSLLESTGADNQATASLTIPADEGQADSELTTLVQSALSEIVIDFLKLDSEDLDTILLDLGFDSIGLTTFANAVNDKYQLDITPVLFFEYPNIRLIGQYIAEEHPEEALAVHQSSTMTVSSSNIEQAPKNSTSSQQQESFSINKGWRAEPTQTPEAKNANGSFSAEHRFVQQPIAIVGASGVMPQSDNLDEYWQKLRNSENNMVTLIPEDRWSWQEYYGDPLEEENKTKSKWGGFMRSVDKFDPLFWGMSPREAEMTDPQQRLFLESVWGAVEDSGHKVSDLAGTKTGLFVGAATRDYIDIMAAENAELDGYSASGTSHAILANRVSFLLGLHGPSAPLDTACSSSLVALHRAIESIHTGSSEMAIVGGVQVMLTPAAFISFGAAGMLASDGKCKTFDERADGYVRGEGSGAIFIKPLSMAESDGDHIYAVIKATAENHGGRSTMLTAPNPNAQADLLVEAYDKAQIDPTTVGYIECHGTGTSLGDPIEIQAMKKAFATLYKKHNKGKAQTPHIGLTSAKTNIGHLETAAGIAGILKVLLSMKNKEIPALLHYEKMNPYINLKDTPFYMVDKTQPWQAIKGPDGAPLPRRAGISSFGFGGANVHVVLEEYLAKNKQVLPVVNRPHLIVLSAKTEERLGAYAELMLAHISKETLNLSDFEYTLQVGRDAMIHRVAFIVESGEELVVKLQSFIDGQRDMDGFYQGRKPAKKEDLGVDISQIKQWFEQQSYAEIFTMWVKGLEVDWAMLYGNIKPNRLSLPTYPFARERYWFSGNKEKAVKLASKVLHPLLHINTSTLRQQSYSAQFKGDEFFIKQNLIDIKGEKSTIEQSVLSEMACLEMVREAVAQATLSQNELLNITLENIHWSESVNIKKGTDVSVALFEADDGQIDYEIYSIDQSLAGETVELLHCHGSAMLNVDVKAGQIDLEQLQAQMSSTAIVSSQFYRDHEQMGMKYKNSLQPVRTAYQGHNQCLVQLSLPTVIETTIDEYVLHPCMMEGALQAAVDLIADKASKHNALITPLSLDKLKIMSACTHEMYVWVRFSRSSGDMENTIKLDIDLIDNQGNVSVTFKALTFNSNNLKQQHQIQRNDFERLLDSISHSSNEKQSLNEPENVTAAFQKLLDNMIKG